MTIALKFADSLNLSELEKQLFSRDFRLSLAKRLEKLLKTHDALYKNFQLLSCCDFKDHYLKLLHCLIT